MHADIVPQLYTVSQTVGAKAVDPSTTLRLFVSKVGGRQPDEGQCYDNSTHVPILSQDHLLTNGGGSGR